jgi:hypothetical protein
LVGQNLKVIFNVCIKLLRVCIFIDMIGIYKITNPNGKIYIGQSINIERRFKEYQIHQPFISIGRKLYNSLCKYGSESHQFEIIEKCLLEQLNEREIYWGIYFNVLGEKGLNLRLGNANGKCSEETKQRIGINNKGKLKPNAGPKRQPIVQCDMQGNFIQEWGSGREASLNLGFNKQNICNALKNRAKSAYGFVWKYK